MVSVARVLRRHGVVPLPVQPVPREHGRKSCHSWARLATYRGGARWGQVVKRQT